MITKAENSAGAPALPSVSAWSVAWTKARCEKSLCEYLEALKVPHFLPLVTKRRLYGARVRYSQLPLFSGYVFFDGAAIERQRVFESRKVAQVLVPNDPEELRKELANLAVALLDDETLRETRFGQSGRRVIVKSGPFRGLYGKLVRYDGLAHLIVEVDFIGKAAQLRMDEAFLEPVY